MGELMRPSTCHPDRPHIAKGLCNACYLRAWREKHPGYYAHYAHSTRTYHSRRGDRLRASYGMSFQDYEDVLAAQGGVCAICHQPPNHQLFHVDHNHVTNKGRGLLCAGCNLSLGHLAPYLDQAKQYLEKNDAQN